MAVLHICAVPTEVGEDLELELHSCELPRGCWGPNPGPLGEQPVRLTTEPTLHDQSSRECISLPDFVCLKHMTGTWCLTNNYTGKLDLQEADIYRSGRKPAAVI